MQLFSDGNQGLSTNIPEGNDPDSGIWVQIFLDWKAIVKKVEQRFEADRFPLKKRFTVSFVLAEFISAQKRNNEIRIHLKININKIEDAKILRPDVEKYLANEIGHENHVTIEFLDDTSVETEEGNDNSIHQTESNTCTQISVPEEQRNLISSDQDSGEQILGKPLNHIYSAEIHQNTEASYDTIQLSNIRNKLSGSLRAEISDDDLHAVLKTLASNNIIWDKSIAKSPLKDFSLVLLRDYSVDPEFLIIYDKIVKNYSAVYLPAYIMRHLRHMNAADGLRYMGLHQIAYFRGYKKPVGTPVIMATENEISRWSTLSPGHVRRGFAGKQSYLSLLAVNVSYMDYYLTCSADSRWEEEDGFYWNENNRIFRIKKVDGVSANECSQLLPDHKTGKTWWHQAPLAYRVQLGMPLCPEDENTLRKVLFEFGVREDPLGAMLKCLKLDKSAVIPDQPMLTSTPDKLYTVSELVLECWGQNSDHPLMAKVSEQAKVLEFHLINPEKDILKIPYYMIRNWGKQLSPGQLWTVIIAMDRVFVNPDNCEYRDITNIPNGLGDVILWTQTQYSKNELKQLIRWFFPFKLGGNNKSGKHYNPWFSVFIPEILSEKGVRESYPEKGNRKQLRVLPFMPLCPEDALKIANTLGLKRLVVQDSSGMMLALEISDEELAVYIPDGRSLRYSYGGTLRFGDEKPVVLSVVDQNLRGIEILTSEEFKKENQWGLLVRNILIKQTKVLSDRSGCADNEFSDKPGSGDNGLFDNLESVDNRNLGKLVLGSKGLFDMLLKLLILNLFDIKKNSILRKPPLKDKADANIDTLTQFNSRVGQSIEWVGVNNLHWDFANLVESIGIMDVKSLVDKDVSSIALVCTALELHTYPDEKITSSRTAVLVAKLRANPKPRSGAFLRLAELGPKHLQDRLRRAIRNPTRLINDPDWDHAMGRAKRDDVIELAQRLGLARVFNEEKGNLQQ